MSSPTAFSTFQDRQCCLPCPAKQICGVGYGALQTRVVSWVTCQQGADKSYHIRTNVVFCLVCSRQTLPHLSRSSPPGRADPAAQDKESKLQAGDMRGRAQQHSARSVFNYKQPWFRVKLRSSPAATVCDSLLYELGTLAEASKKNSGCQ